MMSRLNDSQITIPNIYGGDPIKCSPEELREYSDCVRSGLRKFTAYSMIGGLLAACFYPVKDPAKSVVSKFLVGSMVSVAGVLLGVSVTANSCSYILQQLMKQKSQLIHNKTEEDEKGTTEMPISQDADFMPSFSADQDFSSPINFMLDADSKEDSWNSSDKQMKKKSRVTYDELRSEHRKSFEGRLKKPKEVAEGLNTYDDEFSASKKVATNKYGDVWE